MQKINKLLLGITVFFIVLLFVSSIHVIFHSSTFPNNRENLGFSLYATIWINQNGKLVYYQSGLDPLTDLGFNLTFAKLSGSSSYNLTTYNMNATYISLGNYTASASLNSTCIVLPNEFIRNSTTIHAQVYNGYNLTCLFNGFSGTNSSNCFGINYSPNFNSNDLFAYTSFSQITGIDNTFSITIEAQITGTTS